MNILFRKSIFVKLFSTVLAFVSVINILFVADFGSKRTTPEGEIKVMTYNVRVFKGELATEHDSAKRVPEVVREILEELPDSVGCQESDWGWTIGMGIGLEAEYDCVQAGRDAAGAIGEACSIFYRHRKFRLLDCGTFWLSQTPCIPSKGWDADCNRVCTWAKLENRKTKERYVHINTHLDHKGELARENGTDMVLDFAKRFDCPVVVTGDFNFNEGHELYQKMIGGELKDSKYLAKETMSGNTFNGFGDFDPQGLPIDFLFVSEGIEVSKYHIITDRDSDVICSDHFPVYIEMKLEPQQICRDWLRK